MKVHSLWVCVRLDNANIYSVVYSNLQMVSATIQKLQHHMLAVQSCVNRITSFQFGVVVSDEPTS